MGAAPHSGATTRSPAMRLVPHARVAVVTGAGRGIGRATAEAFAAEGYTVVVVELLRELGRLSERALVKAGAQALFLRTDVSDSASVKETVRAVIHRFGRIDCHRRPRSGLRLLS